MSKEGRQEEIAKVGRDERQMFILSVVGFIVLTAGFVLSFIAGVRWVGFAPDVYHPHFPFVVFLWILGGLLWISGGAATVYL